MAVDKKSQSDKFKKLAEEANCDVSEEHFDESLKGLAKQKPAPASAPKSNNLPKSDN